MELVEFLITLGGVSFFVLCIWLLVGYYEEL